MIFTDYKPAVFAALNADPLLEGRVSQVLEQDQPWPKVFFEDAGAVDWSDNCDSGLRAEVALHVGSKYAGDKEINQYMQAIHNRLHRANLVLSDSNLVLCQFIRHDIMLDSDGVTRHGIIRFELLISGG